MKRNRHQQPKQAQPMVKMGSDVIKAGSSLVSIVIPVHGRFDLLEKCLASIPDACQQEAEGVSVSWNVVIVDNASDRKEADAFYDNLPYPITVIRNKENTGFPHACNQGVSRTRSPLIFLLNSDVILDPGSIVELVKEMDDPTVGVCGMKLVFPTEHAGLNEQIRPAGRLQHIGLSVNIRGEVHHPYVGWDEYHPRVMGQHNVWAVTGAALMIRRTIWTKVGGLWEGYGLGVYDDADVCMAARGLGYNITVVPSARGTHYVGATAEKYQIAYPMQQNYMMFMQRWQGKIQWWDGYIL